MRRLWIPLLLALMLAGCTAIDTEYEGLRQTAQARFDATGGADTLQQPAPTSVWAAQSAAQPAVPTSAPAPTPGPLTLHQATTFWYAPNPTPDQEYGTVPSGVVVEPLARYGDEWVHLRVKDYGELWTRTAQVSHIDTSRLVDYAEGGQ
jgi:hypothetical protein